ncbi:hypothetical protein HanIR_Chr08g0389281 [Helianthus annuus]|nr:hypothetical protein HanIR_Chr08g0389281 [Helianthus annuus]
MSIYLSTSILDKFFFFLKIHSVVLCNNLYIACIILSRFFFMSTVNLIVYLPNKSRRRE